MPTAVVIEPQRAAWMSRMTSFLSPMLEYLGELALAIILVIFMLLKREELRNRIIRLAGQGKIVAATKFVDEAAHRVSRFLLMQAIVNASFGLIFGLGLLLIGVKYALLWGFLGAMLRYLPYIGPYLAVTFPISLSLAMSEGWGTTLMVIGLFLTLELIISNFIEPRLYGQSMGVSEIAMLVSAAFWAFLWGPIGLVLSSPLTVCLVVLGRYIPRLEFLSVLLGDEPALDAGISFYQRLLARDQDEAEDLILEQIKEVGIAGAGLRCHAAAGPGRHQAEPRRAATSPRTTSGMPSSRSGDRGGPGRGPDRRGRADGQAEDESPAGGRTDRPSRRSRSSAARPTTPRIASPWRCSSTCSTRPDGTSR